MSQSGPNRVHDQLWEQLQATFLHCLSYMSDPLREEGRAPSITLGWNGSDRLVGARDGLQYRNHSLVWHLSLMGTYRKHFEGRIEEVILDAEKEFDARRNAQHKLGFILDDIVFNAMSVFDYTAEFVFATHLPDHRSDMKWYKLTQNTSKIEDIVLSELIQSAHSKFVKNLERYRGRVIHKNPELGGVGFTYELVSGKVEHDFCLPEKLINQFPMFLEEDGEIQIDAGAEQLVLETLEIELEIVKQLGKHEYGSRRTNIFKDSKGS